MNTNNNANASNLNEGANSNEKPYMMNVPVTLDDKKGGTGEFYTVWDKKDLSGKAKKMGIRIDDDVKNYGDPVKHPVTGQDCHLVRIKRKDQKRVWYSVSALPVEVPAES